MTSTVWYHGGPRIEDWDHVRWDRDRSSSDLNAEGPGMYWTSDEEEAWSYTRGPDSVVYEAREKEGFRFLGYGKPTAAALYRLFELASPKDQETFLADWAMEPPVTKAKAAKALHAYTGQTSIFDAYVTLYHDLFHYDADAYVSAMAGLGYDGHIIEKGTTGGSKRRQHLVVWRPKALVVF